MRRRNTRQRKLVLDAVRGMNDHPTADEIYLAVLQRDPHIGRGTVYRNLNVLADEGEIRLLKTPGGNRFDWRVSAHSHVICTSCGAVDDIFLAYNPALDDAAGEMSSFSIDSHYTFFEGLCPQCRARLAKTHNGAA